MSQMIQRAGLKVVLGLGKTGLSCVRFLMSRGYAVAVNDSRDNPPGLAQLLQEFPQLPLTLGALDAALLSQAEEIVISPGLSIKEPALQAALDKGIPVVGDIELFAREVKAPVIAITGSNAKSTVTTLVGEMARAAGWRTAVGGNLGTPVLEMLDEQAELYVLELSSFQLETTFSLRPRVATVLNVSEDHMDRYADMQEYHRAKHRIFRHCESCVVNRDDVLTMPLLDSSVSRVSFGLGAPDLNDFGVLMISGERFLARGVKPLMSIRELSIFGDHNVANALAALALGERAGLPMEAMLDTLRTFKGLPHRCQQLLIHDGVAWYNDSKGTNVGATLAAINGLGAAISGGVILVAGGVGKGQDFSPLREPLRRYVKALILIGEDALKIDAAVGHDVPRYFAGTLVEAVQTAKDLACAGDAVLLSPACASFDMFANYEDRGQQFAAVVEALCR